MSLDDQTFKFPALAVILHVDVVVVPIDCRGEYLRGAYLVAQSNLVVVPVDDEAACLLLS